MNIRLSYNLLATKLDRRINMYRLVYQTFVKDLVFVKVRNDLLFVYVSSIAVSVNV